jgi:hypothetical protein
MYLLTVLTLPCSKAEAAAMHTQRSAGMLKEGTASFGAQGSSCSMTLISCSHTAEPGMLRVSAVMWYRSTSRCVCTLHRSFAYKGGGEVATLCNLPPVTVTCVPSEHFADSCKAAALTCTRLRVLSNSTTTCRKPKRKVAASLQKCHHAAVASSR